MKVVYNRYIAFDDNLKEGFRDPKNIEITVPGEENPCPVSLFCPGKKFVLTCQDESHVFHCCKIVEISYFKYCVAPEGTYARAFFEIEDDTVSKGFPRSFSAYCQLLPWYAADYYAADLDEEDLFLFRFEKEDFSDELKIAYWSEYF